MKIGFIVCARLSSRRVPGKALSIVNGTPLLSHLLNRLKLTGFPVCVAVPECETENWDVWFIDKPDVLRFRGHDLDPLARIHDAALAHGFDVVIRVTHDKIFVDPEDVLAAVEEFKGKKLDYLFSSSLTEGTGFEIISLSALAKARETFENVEHVSYAIKAVTTNSWNMPFKGEKNVRLLCDYEEDLVFLETVLSSLGNDCSKRDVEQFCRQQNWVNDLNRLPRLTVYTCARNAEPWIEQAMKSVEIQEGFKNFEYILIDDHSNDRTMQLMAKFKSKHSNVRLIRNQANIGLASSSNKALKEARGKYIVRLDADDFFVHKNCCRELMSEIGQRPIDALYPANYFGSMSLVQQPEEQHHIGGAIFRTAALNHIKFTDGIRGLEGLDFWARARHQLQIGYLSRPIFFYRQRPDSMSKTNLGEREQIRSGLVEKYGSEMADNRRPETVQR